MVEVVSSEVRAHVTTHVVKLCAAELRALVIAHAAEQAFVDVSCPAVTANYRLHDSDSAAAAMLGEAARVTFVVDELAAAALEVTNG